MDTNSPLFETQIIALNSNGQGIGELEGLKVFIEGALVGEKVSAQIEVKKRNYATARLCEIKKASPYRNRPICPIFDQCGGCQIMHLSYDQQLIYKKEKVRDAFKRIAKVDSFPLKDCLPSPEELHYRNKVQLPFFESEGHPSLGFYKKRSHDIVEVEHCFIHSELGQSVYEKLKQLLNESDLQPYNETDDTGYLKHLLIRTAVNSKTCLVVFVTKDRSQDEKLIDFITKVESQFSEVVGFVQNIQPKNTNAILGKKWISLSGNNYLIEHLDEFKFKIAADAFFQVNTPQAMQLYKKALELMQLEPSDSLLDAYCGIGMFSIYASRFTEQITGVEVVSSAVKSAEENVALNQLKPIRFICSPVEKVIYRLSHFDCAFINPPRKGCDPAVIQALCKKQPKKIVYVSCDPATLGRDVQKLCTAGYQICEVQPLDMFPQTAHVETIVLLKLP